MGILTYKVEDHDNHNGFEIGIKPGIALDMTDHFSLITKFGFLGYRDDYKYDNSVSWLSLSTEDLSIGFVYSFWRNSCQSPICNKKRGCLNNQWQLSFCIDRFIEDHSRTKFYLTRNIHYANVAAVNAIFPLLMYYSLNPCHINNILRKINIYDVFWII